MFHFFFCLQIHLICENLFLIYFGYHVDQKYACVAIYGLGAPIPPRILGEGGTSPSKNFELDLHTKNRCQLGFGPNFALSSHTIGVLLTEIRLRQLKLLPCQIIGTPCPFPCPRFPKFLRPCTCLNFNFYSLKNTCYVSFLPL